MSFKLVKNVHSTDLVEEIAISSLTVNVGDLLMRNKGSATWSLATSSLECWMEKAVAVESATTAATSIKANIVLPGQIWEVTSTNNCAAADVGDRMAIGANAGLVNNSGSDVDTVVVGFIMKGYAGALADKRMLGMVIYGSGATQVN